MKKLFLSSLLFLIPSFMFTALQGNLYFFPISLPMVWCAILSYYSFKKTLLHSLLINIVHTVIIVSFTTITPSQLILTMNLFTLSCYFVRERFHTNNWHISLTSGALSFVFLFSQWALHVLSRNLYMPEFFSWVGTSISTVLFAPVFIYLVQSIDEKIQIEKVETLENLRI